MKKRELSISGIRGKIEGKSKNQRLKYALCAIFLPSKEVIPMGWINKIRDVCAACGTKKAKKPASGMKAG